MGLRELKRTQLYSVCVWQMGQVATSELRLTGVREEAEEGSSVDHGGGDALEELQSREEVRCKHSEYR